MSFEEAEDFSEARPISDHEEPERGARTGLAVRRGHRRADEPWPRGLLPVAEQNELVACLDDECALRGEEWLPLADEPHQHAPGNARRRLVERSSSVPSPFVQDDGLTFER